MVVAYVCHDIPSHSMVMACCVAVVPRSRRTVRDRIESNAILATPKPLSPVVRSAHATPSHSQVSPAVFTSTHTPRALSYVIKPPSCGDAAGVRCVQVLPSHSQVSRIGPVLPVPPNSTVTPRSESHASAGHVRGDGPNDVRWIQFTWPSACPARRRS